MDWWLLETLSAGGGGIGLTIASHSGGSINTPSHLVLASHSGRAGGGVAILSVTSC